MQAEAIHLKVRVQSIPEEGFQQGLRSVVHETLAAYGLSGSVAVERTAQFPLDPLAEIQHQSGTVTFGV